MDATWPQGAAADHWNRITSSLPKFLHMFNTLLPMLYLYFRLIFLFQIIPSSCLSSGPFTGLQHTDIYIYIYIYIYYGTYLTDCNELFLLLWIPGEYSSRCWVNSSLTLWQSDWHSTLFYLCCIYTFVQYTCFTSSQVCVFLPGLLLIHNIIHPYWPSLSPGPLNYI